MKKVLVIGAGAVGQVYASGLERGGAEVAFFVRERHREEVEGGLRVARLRMGGRRERHVFTSPRALSTVEEAARERWDAVWLCIPSNGVHEASTTALLQALCSRQGGDVLVVSLTPGLDDRAKLMSVVDEANLVTGLIPFLAWAEPSEAEAGARETVVYFPPLSSCAFEGARAEEAVAALRRGGLPARVQRDLARAAPFGTAFLMPMVAELETAGWRFAAFDAAHRRRFRQASAEARRVVAQETGRASPLVFRVLPSVVNPLVLALVSALVPLDLEAFFRSHFLKVGAQTSRTLAVYADKAAEHGLGPVPALQALREARAALTSRAAEP